MKRMLIKYEFDETAGVYITRQSEVIGINSWDKDLGKLIDRVVRSAPTYIRFNHPELHGSAVIELSFQDMNASSEPMLRQITLRPHGPKFGLNGFSRPTGLRPH
jgi:hypothetical protein